MDRDDLRVGSLTLVNSAQGNNPDQLFCICKTKVVDIIVWTLNYLALPSDDRTFLERLLRMGCFISHGAHCLRKGSFRYELCYHKTSQGGRCGYVEVPSEYSVEIDSPFDLAFAEQVINQILTVPRYSRRSILSCSCEEGTR